MKKIKAAGDEPDCWEARTEAEIIAYGFEEELEVAKEEITHIAAAGVLENGPIWTELWYRHNLSWLDEGLWLVAIPERNSSDFLSEALTGQEGYSFLSKITEAYLERGYPLCQPLPEFLVGLLNGKINPPARRGRKAKSETWIRNFMLHYAARTLQSRYSIMLTRNATSNEVAVSDLLVVALDTELGEELNFGTVQNILTNKKNIDQFTEIRHFYWASKFDD